MVEWSQLGGKRSRHGRGDNLGDDRGVPIHHGRLVIAPRHLLVADVRTRGFLLDLRRCETELGDDLAEPHGTVRAQFGPRSPKWAIVHEDRVGRVGAAQEDRTAVEVREGVDVENAATVDAKRARAANAHGFLWNSLGETERRARGFPGLDQQHVRDVWLGDGVLVTPNVDFMSLSTHLLGPRPDSLYARAAWCIQASW